MLSAINENRCKSSHWPTKSAVIIMVTVKMLQFTTDVFNVTNKNFFIWLFDLFENGTFIFYKIIIFFHFQQFALLRQERFKYSFVDTHGLLQSCSKNMWIILVQCELNNHNNMIWMRFPLSKPLIEQELRSFCI